MLRNLMGVACALFMVAVSVGPSQAQDDRQGQADLPAAVLTSVDYEAVGIDGMGRFSNGDYRSLNEYAERRAEFLAIPFEEVTSALTEAGYLQGYAVNLGIPTIAGDQGSPPRRTGFTAVYEYANPEGAKAALEFNTDYSGVTIADVDTSQSMTQNVGDESVLVRTTALALDEAGPSDELAAWVRVGPLLAVTGVTDYGMSAESLATPAAIDPAKIEAVEQLAVRLAENLTAVAGGQTPNLSAQVVRIVEESMPLLIDEEGYRRLDGHDDPYYGGRQDDFPSDQTAASIAAYEVGQGLGDDVDPFEPYFYVRLYQFEDEATASSFMASVSAMPGATPTAMPDQPAAISENVVMSEYDFEVEPGLVAQGRSASIRAADLVAVVSFESGVERPSEVVFEQMVSAQASCLSGDVCEPIPVSQVTALRRPIVSVRRADSTQWKTRLSVAPVPAVS